MTRETKIGLLVGLAFIIVIGILLSDHMAATTEPPQAPLETAANNARHAIVVPDQSHAAAPTPRQITPREVAPQNPVPTQNEVVQRQVIMDVQVGGSAQSNNDAGAAASNPNAAEPSVSPDNTVTPQPGVDPRLAVIARGQGEELIDLVTGEPAGSGTTVQPRPTPPTGASAKTYTIEPGDHLGKIALKKMGANTKANRDAIVKANPELTRNPDLIVAGRDLNIPTAGTNAPANTTTASNPVVRVLPLTPPRTGVATSVATAQSYTYIVKEGDNSLWGIARDQLGTPQAVAAIKELNKDVLKGGDIIRVGMRLKMPAKPVAAAN